MITLLKNIVLIVLFFILAFSCKNENSLQQFMVTQQEKGKVISFDIPSSMVTLKDSLITPERTKILKSVKKANILAYQIDSLSDNSYINDIQQLKNILKSDKYQELMRYGNGVNAIKIYTVGDENALDEIIAFSSDNTKGWVLIRVLGNDMQLDQLIKLANDVKLDKNSSQYSQLKKLLQGSIN